MGSDVQLSSAEIVAALRRKVADSIETYRNYKHVLCYTLFAALYMVVLYYQASSYQAGEVVQALKDAILGPGGSVKLTFSDEKEVLAYLGNHIIDPIWKDPICGDSKCEWPWEFPAYGPFGCRADCGLNPNVTPVVVVVSADFTAHPSLSPHMLMNYVRWNLCLNDTSRRAPGQPDLCWFQEDKGFSQVQETQIESMRLVDGDWYLRLQGDYAGRVTGAVYNNTNSSDPQQLDLTPPLESCKVSKRKTRSSSSSGTASSSIRRLLADYIQAKAVSEEEGSRVLQEGLKDVLRALKQVSQRVERLGKDLPAPTGVGANG